MQKEYFMKKAIQQAKLSLKTGDVPVGAVVVKDNKIIAYACNKKEKKQNCLAHAEIIAINKAIKKLKTKILPDCELYVTFEPCLMCVGAILSAKIKKVYFGAYDLRFSCANLLKENNFNFSTDVEGGILKEECGEMLTEFFKKIRKAEKLNAN